MESSPTKGQTRVACVGKRVLCHWATREASTWSFKGGKTLFSEKSSNSGYLVSGAESKQKATGMWQVFSLFVGGGHLCIDTGKNSLSWAEHLRFLYGIYVFIPQLKIKKKLTIWTSPQRTMYLCVSSFPWLFYYLILIVPDSLTYFFSAHPIVFL